MSTDIDIDHRLEDIEEKIEQNSKVLRSIKRKLTFDFWFGIIKIGIFVGAFYYVYTFAEPLFIQFKEAYTSFQGISKSTNSLNADSFFDFFKNATTTQQ
jgi:tetrahydromethanopterin S-methyltransferase subunit G